MASKKKIGKKGKGRRKRAKLRKFNLDYFGLLTFTRYYGAQFEDFMYSGEKKQQKGPAAKSGDKKKKKKKAKAVVVPKLPMFPPVPGDKFVPSASKGLDKKDISGLKKITFPTTNVGRFKEKTTKRIKPVQEAGSVRDVLCGPFIPIPPKPQPHGGVFGNDNCPQCVAEGGLLRTKYGVLHKKMRKLLENHFDKAKYILEYILGKTYASMDEYRLSFQKLTEELDPIMNALDDSEWDDHFAIRDKVSRWRSRRKEYEELYQELKRLKREHGSEVEKGIDEKNKTVDELEHQMRLLEDSLKTNLDLLNDWKNNKESKIKLPQEELARRLEELQRIRNGVLKERSTLREILDWEVKMSSDEATRKMERVIKNDIETIFIKFNPEWHKLFAENEKIEKEYNVINQENNLLELEVETLARQVNKLKEEQKQKLSEWVQKIRPDGTEENVLKKLLPPEECEPNPMLLTDYPTTRFLLEC